MKIQRLLIVIKWGFGPVIFIVLFFGKGDIAFAPIQESGPVLGIFQFSFEIFRFDEIGLHFSHSGKLSNEED